jgi:hypothetical protein
MKKLLSFLLISVASATAYAQTPAYGTELLADPSFESSESTFGDFYWNGNAAKSFVSDVDDTNIVLAQYYEAGTQVDTGLFSQKIEYLAGATPTFSTDGFSLDSNRNAVSDFTTNQGVELFAVDNKNVSYLAGDTLQASLRVYVDQWDATSDGLGFRVVGLADGGSTLGNFTQTSAKISSPTGSWQTVNLEWDFTDDFSGELRYDVRYNFTNDGSGTASKAWVDSASMQVIPEPSSLVLVLSAFVATGLVMYRRRR